MALTRSRGSSCNLGLQCGVARSPVWPQGCSSLPGQQVARAAPAQTLRAGRAAEEVTAMDKGEEDAALKEQARSFIENVISSAKEYVLDLQEKEKETAEYDIKNIQWTTCKDFTVQRGQEQIEEYISTWEFHESWLHWTQFLREEDMKYSTRYHYRVCWSTPTRRKPIPRATASVYFIIEVSKIKPATLPVEVFFILETSRLIHRPGECRFREKWLKDIIENKIILMESLIL